MPSYDTDSQILMRFDIDFYAATLNDADTIARNTINRIFGSSAAGLMNLVTSSNVALSGMAISGANYHYQYELDLRAGNSDNATDPDIFNTIFANTAADALAALQANAQRMTNITNMPLKVIWLKAA